jgi:tetratricopeptide (TPR) repeat protein
MRAMERSYADFYKPGPWQRTRSWIKSRWKVVSGTLGAILMGYVVAVVNEVAPAPPLARSLVCQWQEWRAERMPDTEFRILITNLANDWDGRQTELVLRTFLGQTGIEVRRTCRVVEIDTASGSLADAEAKATEEARALLDGWNADLVIWGEVIEKDKELQLWFVSRETGTAVTGRSYSLTDGYRLPLNFTDNLAQELEAVAFSQLEISDQQLESRLAKFRALLSGTDDQLRPRRTALLYSFGRAAAALGASKLDPKWLEEAIVAYQHTLQRWTRDHVALGWAAVQQSLAEALTFLGFVELDKTKLEQALNIFDEALLEWTKGGVVPRVVSVQASIGDTLTTLGSLEFDPARFERGAVAYRES